MVAHPDDVHAAIGQDAALAEGELGPHDSVADAGGSFGVRAKRGSCSGAAQTRIRR
jgi:hypothetical protein